MTDVEVLRNLKHVCYICDRNLTGEPHVHLSLDVVFFPKESQTITGMFLCPKCVRTAAHNMAYVTAVSAEKALCESQSVSETPQSPGASAQDAGTGSSASRTSTSPPNGNS